MSTTKVRVVDLVFDADDRPILDDHSDPGQRRQRKNGGGYLFNGVQYLPGDEIEMPANIAQRELKACGFMQDAAGHSGRHAILEPAEWHERRMARQQDEAKGHAAERQAFAKMSQALESERERGARMQQMIAERDAQRLREVQEAKAEVPPDIASELADARRKQAEADKRYLEQAEALRVLQQKLAAMEAEAPRTGRGK